MTCLTEIELPLDNATQVSSVLEISFKVVSSMSIKLVDSFSKLNLQRKK